MIVIWDEPFSSIGNLTITHYVVEYRILGSKDWIKEKIIPDGKTQHLVSGLTSNQLYEFVVVAYNGLLESIPADPIKTDRCPLQPSEF